MLSQLSVSVGHRDLSVWLSSVFFNNRHLNDTKIGPNDVEWKFMGSYGYLIPSRFLREALDVWGFVVDGGGDDDYNACSCDSLLNTSFSSSFSFSCSSFSSLIIIIIVFKGAIRFFFAISSLRLEPSPIRTLWPEHNRVQITCNTLGAHHVQHVVLRATWYEGTAQLYELYSIG